MPLFGKKSKENTYSKVDAPPAYPVQQATAPMAGQQPQQVQQGMAPPPPYYTAPPAYPGHPQGGYAPQQGYAPQYAPGHAPQYPQQAYAQPPQGYYAQQPQTVVVNGGFDAGARFGPGGASIPPPPPGCAPNAAQMAVAQGHNVVVTQRKSDFMTGGSDGGMVIW